MNHQTLNETIFPLSEQSTSDDEETGRTETIVEQKIITDGREVKMLYLTKDVKLLTVMTRNCLIKETKHAHFCPEK